MRTAIIFLLAVGAVLGTMESMAGQEAPDRAAAATVKALGRLPLYFVENRGVYADEVCYYIQGADKTLFFTDSGITIALKGKERGWTVKLDFVGANKDVRPEGLDKQQAVFSYFTGAERDWKAGLPSFAKIIYRDLWPGIDLVYNGTVNRLKYEFVVAPGAGPSRIRLRYRGASDVRMTDAGALRVETPEGSFEDASPVAWQEIDGKRVPVGMAYALGEDGRFGFEVGDYDRTKPLVLDPAVIVYCGYIGGDRNEQAHGVAVDAAGNAYVTGETQSSQTTFPVAIGPDTTHNGGQADAFVAKVNAAGTRLIYCGYIGGADDDRGRGIAVDGKGSAYVTGHTWSTEKTFPVKDGPDTTFNGFFTDAFVAKVAPDGKSLIYCGYVGGDDYDEGEGIAVDGLGNAYVAGATGSNEKSFPVKIGPDLTLAYGKEAFVAKVASNGKSLSYCGYIGGLAHEGASDIAIDSAGNAFVAGWTTSTETSFPVKGGPDLTHNGGPSTDPRDAFVAKVASDGKSLVYCGYIGGSGIDLASGIAVDPLGSAYLAGATWSDERTFPETVGPDLTHNGAGQNDAFVAKVSPSGKSLAYCGYVGGVKSDYARDIAVDNAGNAFLVGIAYSDEKSFPVRIGPSTTLTGGSATFIAEVNATGKGLVYCGYLNGGGAWGIALDRSACAYVVGAAGASLPVLVGPDTTHNGRDDAFIAKVALTHLHASGAPRPGASVQFTLSANDDPGLVYQLGSSFGTGPIKIGTRTLGLSPDKLLEVSVRGVLPTVFVGYAGVIGTNGRATAKINLPNISGLIGNKIHTAFVTVGPKSPFGIKSISSTYSFTITK